MRRASPIAPLCGFQTLLARWRATRPVHPRHRQPLLRPVLQECGLAFAVLAVWLLSLLAPMHLVSRMASELRLAGVETGTGWTLCIPAGQGDDESSSIPLCPAKALGGGGVLPPAMAVMPFAFRSAPGLHTPLTAQRPFHHVLQGEPQPRAPPPAAQG